MLSTTFRPSSPSPSLPPSRSLLKVHTASRPPSSVALRLNLLLAVATTSLMLLILCPTPTSASRSTSIVAGHTRVGVLEESAIETTHHRARKQTNQTNRTQKEKRKEPTKLYRAWVLDRA